MESQIKSKPTISEEYKQLVGANSGKFQLSRGSQIKNTINKSLSRERPTSNLDELSRAPFKKKLTGYIQLQDFIRMELIQQKLLPGRPAKEDFVSSSQPRIFEKLEKFGLEGRDSIDYFCSYNKSQIQK